MTEVPIIYCYQIGTSTIKELNINSIRNMLETISDHKKGNIDVLVVSETKIDNSFPYGKLLIYEFCTPYRLDQNSNGGELVYLLQRIFHPVAITISTKILNVLSDLLDSHSST